VLPVAHVFTPGDGIGVADVACPFPTLGCAIDVLDTCVTLFVPNGFLITRLPSTWLDASFRFLSLQYYTKTLLDKISKRPLE
jgi:hypothetical protein